MLPAQLTMLLNKSIYGACSGSRDCRSITWLIVELSWRHNTPHWSNYYSPKYVQILKQIEWNFCQVYCNTTLPKGWDKNIMVHDMVVTHGKLDPGSSTLDTPMAYLTFWHDRRNIAHQYRSDMVPYPSLQVDVEFVRKYPGKTMRKNRENAHQVLRCSGIGPSDYKTWRSTSQEAGFFT